MEEIATPDMSGILKTDARRRHTRSSETAIVSWGRILGCSDVSIDAFIGPIYHDAKDVALNKYSRATPRWFYAVPTYTAIIFISNLKNLTSSTE